MTIIALQQVHFFSANVEDQIGAGLALQSMTHFVQFLGQPALGISYASCNAAVAIAPHASYPQLALNAGAQLFSILFGSSRLYTGLDPTFNLVHPFIAPGRPFSSSLLGEHAEQTAIRVAVAQGLAFWNHGGHNHIYVDLTPCAGCGPWLAARPENWYVHYWADLGNQQPVIQEKKDLRSDEFGRQMEPRVKRQKVGK